MNILVEIVDDILHARIADFGIAIVTKNLDSMRTDTRQDVHTPQWSAPEIILGQIPSKESDVYSFAMVTIEVRRERSEVFIACAYCCRTNSGVHWRGSVH
jgi:serine/threonine protein kinase